MTDEEIKRIAWRYELDELSNNEQKQVWEKMTEVERQKLREYLAQFTSGYHPM